MQIDRRGLMARTAALSLLFVAAWTRAPGAALRAQPAVVDSLPKHTIEVWSGYSPTSVDLFGRIEGVRFGAVGVRYLRLLSQSADGRRALEYVAGLLPLAAMTYEPVRGAPPVAEARGTRTLRGIGLTPAGARVRYGLGRWWQPYLEAGAGFVRFADPLPDRRGERFNFVLQVGFGVRLQATPRAAFTLGYRLVHISNGFRGAINPGFDSNLFHLGLTVARF